MDVKRAKAEWARLDVEIDALYEEYRRLEATGLLDDERRVDLRLRIEVLEAAVSERMRFVFGEEQRTRREELDRALVEAAATLKRFARHGE